MTVKESLLLFYLASGDNQEKSSLREWVKNKENIQRLMACYTDDFLYLLFKEALGTNVSFSVLAHYRKKARDILVFCERQRIIVLTPYDSFFPDHILSIQEPPILLFVKGNYHLLSERAALAVVGTRSPAQKSLQSTALVANVMTRHNIIIVSGLAIGCDTSAHQAAIQGHGKTIAVLAHGLDTVYPACNVNLARDIVLSDGCLVSEYPPGIQPAKYRFIERNRIQSALSSGVIVIETETSGGTMHTAHYCELERKPLACIADYSKAQKGAMSGNKQLLGKGAFPIRGEADIDAFLQKVFIKKNTIGTIAAFFPPQPTEPLSTETLLAIKRKKLNAIMTRIAKQDANININPLLKLQEETLSEIASLEQIIRSSHKQPLEEQDPCLTDVSKRQRLS